MKTPIALVMLLTLLAATGCHTTSSEGGVTTVNQEFSITVPASVTIKQGANPIETVTLNRGDYFKQDVQLDIKASGISVTPSSILVKASDKPDVQIQIAVSRDAAIGDYRVSVTGTPVTGAPASTAFVVSVVGQ